MSIEKIVIKNFKRYKEPFTVHFNDGMNILVGDNEAGKSTILEAIHLALTGIYAGRSINTQLSTYLFNVDAVNDYLTTVNSDNHAVPPEIMIEVYLKKGSVPEYEGNGNSEKRNQLEGICFKIAFDDRYQADYARLCDTEKIESLPIEYYEAMWNAFSREPLMTKTIAVKSVLIDSSNYRYQNGSDVYISRAIKEFLEPEDITSISQAHRKFVDGFAKDESVTAINDKISVSSTILNGKISLSADQGVQNSWETSLVTKINEIPFAHAGKGAQCIIKTQLALSHKKAENAGVVLLEEPESHLSFSRLNELLDAINCSSGGKQFIVSTHSSFVANKLSLENIILLANNKAIALNNLNSDTYRFFQKIAGYDTLRFILCKKAILVEGDSDELVVQRCYMDSHAGKLPIYDGIDVMTVGGITFKRYLEIAKLLDKTVVVVTDNDGDVDAINEKFKEYMGVNGIKICFDHVVDTGTLKMSGKDFNYNTLEPKLLKENDFALFNQLFGTKCSSEDDMHKYMQRNKTECAMAIFESEKSISYPLYIKEAVADE